MLKIYLYDSKFAYSPMLSYLAQTRKRLRHSSDMNVHSVGGVVVVLLTPSLIIIQDEEQL